MTDKTKVTAANLPARRPDIALCGSCWVCLLHPSFTTQRIQSESKLISHFYCSNPLSYLHLISKKSLLLCHISIQFHYRIILTKDCFKYSVLYTFSDFIQNNTCDDIFNILIYHIKLYYVCSYLFVNHNKSSILYYLAHQYAQKFGSISTIMCGDCS